MALLDEINELIEAEDYDRSGVGDYEAGFDAGVEYMVEELKTIVKRQLDA
jgi:hypothetical protein